MRVKERLIGLKPIGLKPDTLTEREWDRLREGAELMNSEKHVREVKMEPTNLLDLMREKKEQPKQTVVDVTFGGFKYVGEIVLLPDVLNELKKSLMPLLIEGNEAAEKAGLILPQVSEHNGEGYE